MPRQRENHPTHNVSTLFGLGENLTIQSDNLQLATALRHKWGWHKLVSELPGTMEGVARHGRKMILPVQLGARAAR